MADTPSLEHKDSDNFINEVNQKLKQNIIIRGMKNYHRAKRFSTGVFDLDCSSGGGWPFGKMSMLAGYESTGKTQLALLAMASIENYDHNTKKHIDYFKETKDKLRFKKGTALYLDFEGTYDPDWAAVLGVDTDLHSIARPSHGEQGIDIVNYAIQANAYDLVVVDSLATMTPMAEAEKSAEDGIIGLHARMINRAMRTWTSSLIKLTNQGQTPPALILINQLRLNIGASFGDPRTLPGGKGQRFAVSLLYYTLNPKTEDTTESIAPLMIFRGSNEKNKTFSPYIGYSYEFYHKDSPPFKAGQVNNEKDLLKAGKDCGLIKVEKGSLSFGSYNFSTQKEFLERLYVSPQLRNLLWRSVIKKKTGTIL